jgi:NAD dependent epimerase/dehydratase family enzyme
VLRQLSVPARRRRPRRHPETLFERELVKTRFPRRISLIGGEELGVRAVEFLIEREDIHGPVNLCAPTPINQRELMSILRAVLRKRVGLPASKWMVEIGAALIKTDTELILKSRRVVPKRLLEAGFEFDFPDWKAAADDLISDGTLRLPAAANE